MAEDASKKSSRRRKPAMQTQMFGSQATEKPKGAGNETVGDEKALNAPTPSVPRPSAPKPPPPASKPFPKPPGAKPLAARAVSSPVPKPFDSKTTAAGPFSRPVVPKRSIRTTKRSSISGPPAANRGAAAPVIPKAPPAPKAPPLAKGPAPKALLAPKAPSAAKPLSTAKAGPPRPRSATSKIAETNENPVVPRDRTPRDVTPQSDPPATIPPDRPDVGPTEQLDRDRTPRTDSPSELSAEAAGASDPGLPPLESAPTQASASFPLPSQEELDNQKVGVETDPGAGTDPGVDDDIIEPIEVAAAQKPVLRPATGFGDDEDDEDEPFGDLKTGSKIGGRYTLERILGRGAMGVVFAASHDIIGKRIAIKCLYPRFRASPVVVKRFFREAKIAATVEHPNVIQVFDGGEEDDALFLAMELLDGETLGERLERAGEMPVAEAVTTFLGIMDGVAAVHELGVVHRDLKPDNIFLVRPRYGRPQEPKVLDFGISKLKEPDGSGRALTSFGMVMGTPYYMAPEQVASSRDVDSRADVYSIGIMLYEALVDDVPYDGDNVADIFQAAQAAEAPMLHVRRPDVPQALAEIVMRAMNADIEARFQSVQDFRDALAKVELEPVKEDERSRNVRMTVRDVMSPLATGNLAPLSSPGASKVTGRAGRRGRAAHDRPTGPMPTPAAASSGASPLAVPDTDPRRRVRLEEDTRDTHHIEQPSDMVDYATAKPASSIPSWAIAVIFAAGLVTFGAVLTAALVLLL